MCLRKWFAILLLPAVCVWSSAKAQPQSHRKPERGPHDKISQDMRPQEIIAFINSVRSAPPEFAADILIRLAASENIKDPLWKRELLEEAFRTAVGAQQPVKRVYFSPNPVDTRAGYRAYGFDMKLDVLSLQCRAVDEMLAIDKLKARELFSEMPKPELPPLDCDALAYEVGDLYITLKKIVQNTFNAEEIQRNEDIGFLDTYLGNLASPAQVGPAADTIVDLKLSPLRFETALDAFARALTKVAGDDRSFWASRAATSTALNRLITRCKEQNISTYDLLRAYRSYLLQHLNSKRCADSYQRYMKWQVASVRDFNERLRATTPKSVLPISEEDIKPSEITGEEKTHLYWQSRKASRLFRAIKDLRFGSGKTQISDTEMKSLEWQNKLDRFLSDLAQWNEDDEDSIEDYFHQKTGLLKTLLALLPLGSTRDKVLKQYVLLFDNFDLKQGSRIDWFWRASSLVIQPDGKRPAEPPQWLDVYGPPKNHVLVLYLELRSLAPGRTGTANR
jgi:hypothetical protein